MLYIGIDLGTSAVRLLLMEGDGTVKNIVSREYPLYFPQPGWSEQDPADWYAKTMEARGLVGCSEGRAKGADKGL